MRRSPVRARFQFAGEGLGAMGVCMSSIMSRGGRSVVGGRV